MAAHEYEPGDSTHPMHTDPACRLCGGAKKSHTPERRVIRVLMSFEVGPEAKDEDIDVLFDAATAQIEDPRDADGYKVPFDVSMITGEWHEEDD